MKKRALGRSPQWVVGAILQARFSTTPVSKGSLGGPLLDAWGRVDGIFTSKLIGGAEGLAFARRIELQRRC
ncbi:MAG: hypothetical protein IPN01_31745 [Deltaproteobacteria bacterium]|nr:hypothetical protein [Deltaproteobacteria bacterium]